MVYPSRDLSFRGGALLLGGLAALFGLGLAVFGHPVIDEAGRRALPLLYISAGFGFIGAALALALPAFAGFALLVAVAGWLGLDFIFIPGFDLLTLAAVVLTAIAAGLALAAAGARQIVATGDAISIWVGKLAAVTIIILTAVVCYEVFMRYVLRMPTRWAYDMGYMLYGAGFILAGGYALAQNAQVRADVIYRFWRPRVQATVDLVLFLLFYFPAAFFFIYQGYLFAERSWVMREFSSASPFNIPVYHYKTLIPIAGLLLFMQGIAEVVRAILCLRDGEWPPRRVDVAEIDEQVREGRVPLSIAASIGADREADADAVSDGTNR